MLDFKILALPHSHHPRGVIRLTALSTLGSLREKDMTAGLHQDQVHQEAKQTDEEPDCLRMRSKETIAIIQAHPNILASVKSKCRLSSTPLACLPTKSIEQQTSLVCIPFSLYKPSGMRHDRSGHIHKMVIVPVSMPCKSFSWNHISSKPEREDTPRSSDGTGTPRMIFPSMGRGLGSTGEIDPGSCELQMDLWRTIDAVLDAVLDLRVMDPDPVGSMDPVLRWGNSNAAWLRETTAHRIQSDHRHGLTRKSLSNPSNVLPLKHVTNHRWQACSTLDKG